MRFETVKFILSLFLTFSLEMSTFSIYLQYARSLGFLSGKNGRPCKRVSMEWWLLRLSAKILALLRLSVNFLQLRLTKKLNINFFCFKKLNIN